MRYTPPAQTNRARSHAMKGRHVLAAAALAAALPAGALAGPMYVSSRFAKVRDGKTATSPVIAQIGYGQPLDVVGDDGTFWKVKFADGRLGFITKNWLTAAAPGKDGFAEQIGAKVRGGSGGQVSYTAGARGLTEQAQAYGAAHDKAAATAAVARMENYKVNADDLDKFQLTGKIGEYKEFK
ncbi:MAG: SH3 domain-containing protein [Myxococcales bacterium]|nr:SH3 domain-containing protein [Myxococcales bacterium]